MDGQVSEWGEKEEEKQGPILKLFGAKHTPANLYYGYAIQLCTIIG